MRGVPLTVFSGILGDDEDDDDGGGRMPKDTLEIFGVVFRREILTLLVVGLIPKKKKTESLKSNNCMLHFILEKGKKIKKYHNAKYSKPRYI